MQLNRVPQGLCLDPFTMYVLMAHSFPSFRFLLQWCLLQETFSTR